MVDFPVFDADNHYYEATDAFTRHLDPSLQKRTMQWANIDGKQRLLVGGSVNRFIPNPTFERVSKAGALADYFRAKAGVGDMRARRSGSSSRSRIVPSIATVRRGFG